MANSTNQHSGEGPVPGTVPEEVVTYLRTLLSSELKENLEAWVQRRFMVITIVGAIAGFFGITALVHATVSGMVRAELATWKEDIKSLEADTRVAISKSMATSEIASQEVARARTAVGAAVTEAQAASDNAKAATQAARDEIEQARASVGLAVKQTVAAADAARRAASEARETAEAAKSRAEEVIVQVTSAMPQSLSDDDKTAILVRQVSRKTGGKNPQGRDLFELTFTLDVDPEGTSRPASQILAHIEKVEYVFDARWFSPAVVTVSSLHDGFRYSLLVFGSTNVKAVVHLKSPREILIREGSMALAEGTTFKGN